MARSTKATKATKAAKATKASPARKAAKAGNDNAIVTNITDRSGAHVVVSSSGGATVTYPRNRETPELRAASAVGADIRQLSKLIAALPPKEAHVAKGVDSRNSPQTMATVRSAKDKARAAKAAEPKAPKADKAAAKAERKAKRAAKAAPKSDDSRKITIVNKKFTFGGDGTARRASWDAAKTGITVAEYVAAGGKAKYLPRWVSAGAIKLA